MPQPKLHLESPEEVRSFLEDGELGAACAKIAELVDLQLALHRPGDALPESTTTVPIRHRDEDKGRLFYCNGQGHSVENAATAISELVTHSVDREVAVGDLASALMTSYEELNLLYNLLPDIATKVNPSEIGELLVAETARTLDCERVSVMMLDEKSQSYRILASRGLPQEALDQDIPVHGSVAGKALDHDGLMIVNDMASCPELQKLSQGTYDSKSFAVVTVPLQARGEPLGFITATGRRGEQEFTAHDVKLLEGLSAMGASALLNCRLHSAVNKQMISTIHALASAVDAKDQYTHDHAGRVAELCVATACEMGITEPGACREIRLAGLLHDIGKIGIPDAILTKTSELTPDEFAVMRQHVEIGPRIVEHVPGLEPVALAIRHHHERFDGLGYPAGLAGDAIPLASALISVADSYDALTSDRPYRKAGSSSDALKELRRCRGTQLHPDVVDAFVRVIERGEIDAA